MRTNSTPIFVLASVFAFSAFGCAGAPKAPFDTLKESNATAYRLQNYEPPEQVAAPVPGAAPGAIPGLPPEIQAWIQQGAQALPQLIPPGLLPPGLIPGAPTAPAPVAANVPRFHTFRILGQTQVMDPDLKEKLADLLGDEDSFDTTSARCAPGTIYPELGLSWSAGPGASNDLLISFSCSQVVSRSFAWPHQATGMKPATTEELTKIVQKVFPQGS